MADLKSQALSREAPAAHDSRQEVLQTVVGSPVFQRAPRLRDFLSYVGECALQGREQEISEHCIGVRVFGKDESFNPAEDNIVRASARMLRLKLSQYFAGEGAALPWRIEIPKGSYVPVFTAVETATEAPAAPPAATRTPRWMWVALALLAGLAAVLAFNTVRPQPAPTTLWSACMHGHPNLTIVASDSLHAWYQAQQNRLTPFDVYAGGAAFPATPPPGTPQNVAQIWPLIVENNWSHVEDVRIAIRLATNLPERGAVDLVHPRQLRIESFRKGEDFLLVGGRRVNPWVALFESELDFRMEFPLLSGPGQFHNLHPRPGEQSLYVEGAPGQSPHRSYARIAIVPGLAGRGRIVLLAGTGLAATNAAGELLLSPASLEEVQHRLGAPPAGRHKIEVLLETSSISGAARDYRIVAVR